MKNEIMTIHDVRSKLDRSLELAEKINKDYLDNHEIDTYDIRSLYEFLRKVNSARWTNNLL